jgi:hypothetical protein
MDGGVGKVMYLNYYSNGIIYLNGSTYYISANGSQYNGNSATATTAARATRSNGQFYIDDDYGCSVIGVYSSYRFQGVYSMGPAYVLPTNGTTPGNLYGMAWSHPNAGGQAANLSSHGLLVMVNGSTYAAISSNIWISGTYYGAGTGLTGTAASLSIGGNAATATSAGYLTGGDSSAYMILLNANAGDLNTYNTPGLYSSEYNGSTNRPIESNGHWIQISDAGGTDVKTQWYYQSNGAGIYMRLMWGNGTWRAWRTLITDSNIGSQSVATAATLTNFTAAYSSSPLNADSPSTLDAIGYVNAGTALFGQTDGGLYSSAYSTSWYHQIFGDFRTGQIAIRGKNSGTWQAWRTVIDSGNIGSQSVSYAATAGSAPANGGTATAAAYLNGGGQIYRGGFSGNWNTDFQNTPASSYRYYGDNAGDTNSPGGSWWFSESYRHSNSSNYWGTQVAWGWEDNANRLATRNITGNSFGGWVYYLNSSNFTSYIDAPNKAGTSYYQVNTWLQMNGTHGMYWPSYNGAHIYANSSSYTQLRFDGVRGGYTGVYLGDSAVNGMMYDTAGNGGVYREANGRWYFYHLLANNCTGINTSTTSASYGLYVSGGIYSTGDIVAYSDERKKTNIITINNSLEKILQLRGVYYERTDDETHKRQVGVIAQEMNKVLPEAVTYASDIDEYGVQYGNVVGVLIEAIKEQQLQIEELKNKLDNVLSSR